MFHRVEFYICGYRVRQRDEKDGAKKCGKVGVIIGGGYKTCNSSYKFRKSQKDSRPLADAQDRLSRVAYSPTVTSGLIFSMILSPIPFTLVRSVIVVKLPLVAR